MNAETPPPEVAPTQGPARLFSEIPAVWARLPHMNEVFFSAEVARSSALNTFLGVLIYAVVATLSGTMATLGRSLSGAAQGRPEFQTLYLIFGCLTFFLVPISFYINTGMIYLGALVFGGHGNFNDQAYLASLFVVPIGFVSSLIAFLGLIPVVGPILEWPLLLIVVVVTTVYQYRNVKVVHGLASGRAAGAVLAPFALIFCLCLPVFVISLLIVLGPVIGNTFSTINQSLLTPAP